MDICEICYNTGKLADVGYCGCVVGKMRKREVEQKTKNMPRASVTSKLSVDITTKYEHDFTSNYIYQVGDWVVIDTKVTLGVKGIKGFVVEILKRGVKVQTIGAYKCGLRDGIIPLYNEQVTPALQESVKIDPCIIDLALQTKDEEWFKQLTRGMAK